ncbi:helix-turn-helix transcriptional regulator [Blastococcus sp. URHD0036]|uniref:AraC family transcriptional regulator n=1 Tax=Blastococcus sp. URHD0036 TaxID=1380356 RepID=UPI00068C8BB6|nr:helix-turn-helix transcriptional regulator [Blastococcus sp. URHD0036]
MTATVAAVPRDVHPGVDGLPAWTCRFPAEEPGGWGLHDHAEHQLVWTATGAARVLTGRQSWLLPPSRALLVPGGTAHDVVLVLPAALHCLYVRPAAWPDAAPVPVQVAVSPLLRELLVFLAAAEGVQPLAGEALALVRHELDGAAVPDDGLAVPADPRARAVAARLLADPADGTPLRSWARRLRVGESTLRRSFVDETGLPFTEWRSRARVRAALPLLERGVPVAAVARRVGYSSATGFAAAFRRRYGMPPGAWRSAGQPGGA